jgi:D-galactarolactone cycloisomerase
MRIIRAEPIWIAVPYEHGAPKPVLAASASGRTTQDAVYIRVETEDGLVGWGEGFGFAACSVTHAAFARAVAPLAIGRDATDIEGLMRDLARRMQNMARNGPVAYALSGLDIALWDLAGKRAARPLHDLLGGAKRMSVPAYASLLRLGKPEYIERVIGIARERGYRHVKLHERTVEAVEAARSALGDDADLMLDVNCTWSVDEALVMAAQLKRFRLAWLEEPIFPPDDFDGLARLRREGGIPIAAGENLGNLMDFRHMIALGAVDVAQPDVAKMGGVTEMRKAIEWARDARVHLDPHSPLYGPALAATIHILATSDEPTLCEFYFADLEANPIGDAATPKNGSMNVPTGHGLGVSVDEDLLDRYRVE